ncbi:hypothetical protein [Flavobacterium orientale]|uniref:HNH nuclease domain-containing protein n=1 Tax=Flavobacterium orientale TaxID=1756020 RepID=A0A916Y1M3_9FLAO|nr:hypothetical protein [Flavobacterium orientale]GGD26382.1 hypothetical protein GCM10011343_15760 [Flavobacterium orientale]
MIYINSNDAKIKSALNFHINGLFSILKRRVSRCTNSDIRNFLSDGNLMIFLQGNPDEIQGLNNQFYSSITNYTFNGYNDFRLNIDKEPKSRAEKCNVTKYRTLHLLIETIFNYETSFSKKTTKYSTYNLAKNLDINTCVYCNRMYTKTVFTPDKLTRPEFDHWFPKSKYPLLALSFYNLIPSCHICNSSLKGATNLNLNEYLHPYIDDEKTINNDIKFSYYNKSLNTYGFKMNTLSSKGKNTIEAFKIKEIYETHEEEIKELRRIRDVYSDSYLQKLSTLYKGIISQDEVYRLAFGVYIEEAKFEKRPLSKMKKDILIELGIITKNEK